MEELDQERRNTKRKAVDLSVVQVAASALATVVGAVLASELGVYGTIVGAAVVSVGATIGSALFQHLFRRTGEEIRSRVPARAGYPGQSGHLEQLVPQERQQTENAAGFEPFDPFDPGGEATRAMAAVAPPEAASVAVYRSSARVRPKSWKTYALATGLVFTLAMGAVTVVELVADKPIAAIVKNEPGTGTSLGGGSTGEARQEPARTPDPAPSGDATPGPSGSSTPDPSGTPAPSSSPSASGSPSTDPTQEPTRTPPADPTPTGGAGGAAEGAAGTATPPASPQS